MHAITVKYEGECKKCRAVLAVGARALYDRQTGIFCPGCAPTDPEEIRSYRQERADMKADRYQEWASKRRERAQAILSHNERFTGDIAFNTQPGHIPFRARIIAQDDRAFESLQVAERMESKADSLRQVVVAGDAERRREVSREAVREWIKVGLRVHDPLFGDGEVLKVNKKTASVRFDRGFVQKSPLDWVRPTVAQPTLSLILSEGRN